MELVKAICPQCGGTVEVDENFKTAKCPFCRSSFVIKETKQINDKPALITKVIDVNADNLQNELDIFSLFGWDFKDRKTHRIYEDKIRLDDGTIKQKHTEVFQITLQRDTRASWCTGELLNKEKQFFKLRDEYQKTAKEYKDITFKLYAGNLSFKKDYKKQSAYVTGFGFVLSFVFILTGGIACNVSDYGWIPIIIGITFIPATIALAVVTSKQGEKQEAKKKKEVDEKFAEVKNSYQAIQKPRINEMNEIIDWAREHMKNKFGYIIESEINIK